MEHILFVDDEIEIAAIVKELLEEEGYKVTCLHSPTSVIKNVKNHTYNLILLDIMMPNINGFDLCKSIREITDVPILFLTAKTGMHDQIKGLNVGADDYINKPFSHEQLLTRINAHLRRERRSKTPVKNITYKDLTLDNSRHELQYKQEAISLTNKEFKLLEALMSRPGQIFSKDHLYEIAWGREASGQTHTVTEHIRNIRARIQTIKTDSEVIRTVWGVGYKVE
ncbi:response regulator transcription factor [Geomicrobium sp. JCM 19055]|uniref:response regulator transcription factor n=1 Tax=Geomicrobium sp. JCM 19055 TaxID=1460649 RepID=UPI00045ED4D5|nr:response regulator transcription factor [Geomicrobium sp. JCM 19055]GAJ99876.1 two-component response regulator [Geomicrobium sp. JCM 19055]